MSHITMAAIDALKAIPNHPSKRSCLRDLSWMARRASKSFQEKGIAAASRVRAYLKHRSAAMKVPPPTINGTTQSKKRVTVQPRSQSPTQLLRRELPTRRTVSADLDMLPRLPHRLEVHNPRIQSPLRIRRPSEAPSPATRSLKAPDSAHYWQRSPRLLRGPQASRSETMQRVPRCPYQRSCRSSCGKVLTLASGA